MSDNAQNNDYSLLSLILPKGTAMPVVEAIGQAGASGIFEMTSNKYQYLFGVALRQITTSIWPKFFSRNFFFCEIH